MRKNFVLNPYGVRIKKCCASCWHKQIGKGEDERICMKGQGSVKKNYLCKDWALAEGCMKIKMEHRGKVKTPHFIAWMKKEVERIAESDREYKEKMLAIQVLPERYENDYGSRFI